MFLVTYSNTFKIRKKKEERRRKKKEERRNFFLSFYIQKQGVLKVDIQETYTIGMGCVVDLVRGTRGRERVGKSGEVAFQGTKKVSTFRCMPWGSLI